jgi:hypothetical protein
LNDLLKYELGAELIERGALIVEWVIICVLIIAIIINLVVACEMKRIAESKGHSGRKYFNYSFWLGIAGWTIVAALPDLTLRQFGTSGAIAPKRTKSNAAPPSRAKATVVTTHPTTPTVYSKSELFVKANSEGNPDVKVIVIHNGQLTEAQLNHLQTLRLDEARKYCADRKVNLITG